MDLLSLRPGYRAKNSCEYDDFYVNGNRLADILKIGDFIPPLGWLDSKWESKFAAMLLRKTPSDLRLGRIPLFVCPECADYGCGVGTCEIEREGDFIVWRNFGWETDNEDALIQSEHDRGLVFRFERHAYWQTLSPFRGLGV